VARSSWITRALVAGAIALLLCVVVIGAVAWIGSERALNPTLDEAQWTVADFPALAPETVTFDTQTGVTLAGSFYPGDGERTVIVCHGFSSRQDNLLPLVDALNAAGYNVLTYDARHPSTGDGVYTTFGILEHLDLISAIDYLVERPDVDPDRIGVYGLSLGAAAVILAAAEDERIRAVVAEAGFSDASNVISTSFEHFIGLPAFPFAPATQWVAERRAGLRLKDAQAVDVIDAISPRPILLIHGLDDDAVPPDHSERLYAAAREPKEVWFVPDAGHGGVRDIEGDSYDRRIIAFFEAALAE
jgi:uncharacterized protein